MKYEYQFDWGESLKDVVEMIQMEIDACCKRLDEAYERADYDAMVVYAERLDKLQYTLIDVRYPECSSYYSEKHKCH